MSVNKCIIKEPVSKNFKDKKRMKKNKKNIRKKCENPIKFLALKLKLFAFGIGFLSIVDGNSPKAVPHDQLSEVINFTDQSLFTKWGKLFFEVACGIVCT